jgi:hypothetical protein
MSKLAKFQVSRTDGRSNAQVIIDLVKGGEPGQIYKYSEIISALETNTAQTYDIPSARNAVYSAHDRLLKECAIALQNIPGVGFRLAPASDHQVIANMRKRRSDTQLKRGLRTLQNVRWNEMDSETRKAHEGTLMVMSVLWANQQALDVRQSRCEKALKRLAGDSWSSEEPAALLSE